LLFFTGCSAGFEGFGGDARGNELATAVVTAAELFEHGLLAADEAFTEAGKDDAIVEKIFGVDCEEGTTVDETRIDVHVVRGWNLVTSGNDITEPLELFTPTVDVLVASGTDAVLTDGDVTVVVEGLTHVGNRNTPGDGTLLVAVEGVGTEETNFTGIRPVTSGVGFVSVATVTTVTEGLTVEDRDISAEYVVVLVINPIGFTAQVLVISGESTVPVDDVGTVTDKLGFTPALDTDTKVEVVVAVVVATVVVGKTGGWLGKGY
jgi:hypothetical protein